MDSFFGIGAAELLVVLLLAGLVMGPERIRDVARFLGRVTAQMQAISREFARQLNAELDAIDDGDVRDTVQDVRELQRQIEDLRQELRSTSRSVMRDGRQAVEETRSAARKALPAPAQDNPADDKPRLPTPLNIPDDPA